VRRNLGAEVQLADANCTQAAVLGCGLYHSVLGASKRTSRACAEGGGTQLNATLHTAVCSPFE
jgi:hypothetical protein